MDNDVYAIAQKYLRKIKKTGPDNIMAVCPFHRKVSGEDEKTPSFTMNLSRGLYFCFACQEKGNLTLFLRNVGVSRLIIEKHYAHIIEQVQSHKPKARNPLNPDIFKATPLPESLLGMFDYCPTDLVDDGFPEELLQKYDVGFDKEHMRITFPLRDLEGKLVGISGRTVLNETPRYKVYDTEYEKWGLPYHRTDKRTVLWNADRVYPSAFFAKSAKIVVVEGFKACLRLIQHGVPDTVALLGTYLSPDHRWILERIGAEVYIMLDNNEWGHLGAARVASQLAESMTVKVVEYPDDRQQPSDLGPNEVHAALAGATDYYKWATEEKNKWLLEKIRRVWET